MASGAEQPVPCGVCGALDHRAVFSPRRSPGPVVRCRQCGLLYISPRRDERALIFDGPELGGLSERLLDSHDLADVEVTGEWPLLEYRAAEEPALVLNNREALNRLGRWVQPPGRLLDFGCGGGFFLGTARDAGWEIFGVEPLPGHAIYARARFNARVLADTLRPGMFPPEYFDVITAFQVFEHLPAPLADLNRLASFLRPGGALLIEVPNIATWGVRLLGPRHRHFVQSHLNFFTPQTLRRLITQAGLAMSAIYFPGRRMTLRHLVAAWGGRLLPPGLARAAAGLTQRAGLEARIVSINVGDIVAAVAVKP